MSPPGRLFANVRGEAGPTVVLLHGFGGSHAAWRQVAARLARRHRVLAYDLPGHGRSLHYPDAGPAKLAAIAILDDLAARGFGRVHVAGHSMGGAVATLMALADANRIASLSLLAPGGFGEAINAALLRRYAKAATLTELAACLREMSGPEAGLDADGASEMVADRKVAGQSAMLAAIVEPMTRGGRQGMIPPRRLADLSMPVTVAWGRQDRVLPVAQALGLPAGFTVRLFERAGHMLAEECPDAVALLIADTVAAGERAWN